LVFSFCIFGEVSNVLEFRVNELYKSRIVLVTARILYCDICMYLTKALLDSVLL